jgi:hypothetical protein
MPRKASSPAASAPAASPAAKPKPVRQPTPPTSPAQDAAEVSETTVRKEIAKLAYQLSEKRNFEPGHETEDWLAAEAQVKARLGLTGKPN